MMNLCLAHCVMNTITSLSGLSGLCLQQASPHPPVASKLAVTCISVLQLLRANKFKQKSKGLKIPSMKFTCLCFRVPCTPPCHKSCVLLKCCPQQTKPSTSPSMLCPSWRYGGHWCSIQCHPCPHILARMVGTQSLSTVPCLCAA